MPINESPCVFHFSSFPVFVYCKFHGDVRCVDFATLSRVGELLVLHKIIAPENVAATLDEVLL